MEMIAFCMRDDTRSRFSPRKQGCWLAARFTPHDRSLLLPDHRKWPARHPDRIQLYSLPTPNGIKVSMMLEETGLPYEPHRVGFDNQRPAVAGIPVAQPQ